MERSCLSGELLPTQKARVQEALSHALKEIVMVQMKTAKGRKQFCSTVQRLVAQEFWHSLNRKNLILSCDVEHLIYLTIKNLE